MVSLDAVIQLEVALVRSRVLSKLLTRAISVTAAILLLNVVSAAQVIYFPNKALASNARSDRFIAGWYSRQLQALEEPSLLELAKVPTSQSYRFLWLRTFHHPVAIRLDVKADGTAVLTKKIANGAGGFGPGILTENTSRPLTAEQRQAFLAKIEQVRFWTLPAYIHDQSGTDGSEWIIEGTKGGKYHVVSRWSPEKGPVHELGLALAIELAGMTVPKDELY